MSNPLIILECVSVFIMLTLFTRRVFNGHYQAGAPGGWKYSVGDAFFGYLFLGLLPPVALAYILGQLWSAHDKKKLK